jgi:hypothetical protein
MATNYNQVGVKVGDTADYKISQSFSTDNMTRFYVTYISGTVVTADDLTFSPNGTLDSSTSWTVNISSYGNLAYPVLLAAGLKVGDHLSSDPSSPTIDTNTTLNVAGTSRLAIHAHETGLLYYLDGYWDQATGLLIEGNFFVLVGWFNLTLISTSVWSSSGGVSITTVAFAEGCVIVVLLIVIFFVARRGGKHK